MTADIITQEVIRARVDGVMREMQAAVLAASLTVIPAPLPSFLRRQESIRRASAIYCARVRQWPQPTGIRANRSLCERPKPSRLNCPARASPLGSSRGLRRCPPRGWPLLALPAADTLVSAGAGAARLLERWKLGVRFAHGRLLAVAFFLPVLFYAGAMQGALLRESLSPEATDYISLDSENASWVLAAPGMPALVAVSNELRESLAVPRYGVNVRKHARWMNWWIPLWRLYGDMDRGLIPDDAVASIKPAGVEEDALAQFFLHLIPTDEGDLSEERRRHGFDNRDFSFKHRGNRTGERCVALRHLPDYPVVAVRTGQFTEQGCVWEEEFSLPGGG